MPTLTVTKNYSDGTTLTQLQLNQAFNSVETFVNTTKLDSTNLQNSAVTSAVLAAAAIQNSHLTSACVDTPNITTNISNQFVPTGAVLSFAGTAAPTGFFMCDGTAVSRTTYASLYAIIGITHGHGDGTTTFNVPDYRGRFLRGVDGAAGLDPDKAGRTAMATGGNTGNAVGTVQTDDYPTHAHSYNQSAGGGGGADGGSGNGSLYGGVGGATTGNAGAINGGSGAEVRPKNAYVNYIIKS